MLAGFQQGDVQLQGQTAAVESRLWIRRLNSSGESDQAVLSGRPNSSIAAGELNCNCGAASAEIVEPRPGRRGVKRQHKNPQAPSRPISAARQFSRGAPGGIA